MTQQVKSPTKMDQGAYLWLALMALSGLFATGKWTIAVAVWLAPVFALRFLRGQKAGRGYFLVFLASYLPGTLAWYGLAPFPMPIYPLFMVINILFGTLPYLFDRLLTPRLQKSGYPSFLVTLVYPLAVTAAEYVLMTGGPMGSFGAQAYTQYDIAVLTQLVSVTGLWGITFLIAWFASIVNWVWEEEFNWGKSRTGIMVYGSILLLVVLYGSVRLLTAPDATETVQVASFTAAEIDMRQMNDLLASDNNAFRAETISIHERYLAQTTQLADEGAKIIFWPELAGIGLAEDVEALIEQGQAIARQEGIYLAMPVFIFHPDSERTAENKLFMADPNGEIVLEHVKFGGNILEGTEPGDGILQIVDTPYGKITAVICWDTDFPETIIQAGRHNVDILLSPAHVWPEVAEIHAEMSAFRAIENGLTVIQQAEQGLSIATGPYGELLATADHFKNERVMQVNVPIVGTTTIYPQIGNIIGQLSLVGFVLILLWVIAVSLFRRMTQKGKTI